MEDDTERSQFESKTIDIICSDIEISPLKSDLDKTYSNSDEKHKPEFFNKRPLSKSSSTYELEKFERNALIIINQKRIYDESMLHYITRHGTEKDVEALRDTFERFNFEVHECNDYKKDEIFEKLKKFLQRDWSDYGCIAVAILTHGSDNGKLYASDQAYYETDLINEFKVHNNPSLITKPKVILIQACRGENIDPGVQVFHPQKLSTNARVYGTNSFNMPTESDMLIVHSSTAGNVSHRDIYTGSWFIQELCSKIRAFGDDTDLLNIITLVKREIAVNKQHEDFKKRPGMEISKQMPVVSSTLLRKLYLRKYIGTQGHKTLIEIKDAVGHIRIRRPVIENKKGENNICPCCVHHYNYMKKCLKYYLEENPEDHLATNFLDIANTLEDGEDFDRAKERMNKIISRHLKKNAVNCPFFKYVYFNNH